MADKQALDDFARWVAGCSGNEKQEARTFIEKVVLPCGRDGRWQPCPQKLIADQDGKA